MVRRGENVVIAMKSKLPWHEKYGGCGVYTNHDQVKYHTISAIKKLEGKKIQMP